MATRCKCFNSETLYKSGIEGIEKFLEENCEQCKHQSYCENVSWMDLLLKDMKGENE